MFNLSSLLKFTVSVLFLYQHSKDNNFMYYSMSSSQGNLQPVVGSQVENTVNNTNTLSVSKNPSDRFILTKAGMYVGKGYLTEGLFKLNVLVTNTMNNKKNTSVYIVDSFVLWHARL